MHGRAIKAMETTVKLMSAIKSISAMIIAASMTTAIAKAEPFDAMLGFKTPSGNIHCQIQDFDDSLTYLRCDILEIQGRMPPRPRDCEYDWGQAFALDKRRAQRMCYSDTVMDKGLQTLPYGSTWRGAGFTCVSEPTGLTCSNRIGRGFYLSRASQRLF